MLKKNLKSTYKYLQRVYQGHTNTFVNVLGRDGIYTLFFHEIIYNIVLKFQFYFYLTSDYILRGSQGVVMGPGAYTLCW